MKDAALQQAEQECLDDADVRALRQARETERRQVLDMEYIQRFAVRVRELFPSCPAGVEQIIAEHACQKYSGRVGRSVGAKSLDEEAVRLAVIAHIRHAETVYDTLLSQGVDRYQARDEIKTKVNEILDAWS